jgi:leader peptidase (prepilin peptidase)/N-methyltransferase
MIGAFLGWQAVIFTIFVGSAVGTILGIAVALKNRKGRKTAIPFGPFLSLGAILYLFHGQEIVRWYIGLMR